MEIILIRGPKYVKFGIHKGYWYMRSGTIWKKSKDRPPTFLSRKTRTLGLPFWLRLLILISLAIGWVYYRLPSGIWSNLAG